MRVTDNVFEERKNIALQTEGEKAEVATMKNLIIRNIQALANDKKVVCTNAEPIRDYVDGHYTNSIKGQRYDCAFAGIGYQVITIKTEETVPSITMEMIQQNDGEVEVTADDFVCKIYADRSSGELRMSATASTVRPVKMKGDDDNDPIF